MSKSSAVLYSILSTSSCILVLAVLGLTLSLAQNRRATSSATYKLPNFFNNQVALVVSELPVEKTFVHFVPTGYTIIAVLFMLVFEPVLIAVLLVEIRRRGHAQDLIVRDFASERVLTKISTALADCPPERVDVEMESGLRELMNAEGADHAGWLILRGDSPEKSYCVNRNREVNYDSLDLSCLPWSVSRLLQGNPVVVSRLGDLPESASFDKSYLCERQVKSALLMPCGLNGLRGVLVICSTSREQTWTQSVLTRIAVLGNIITNAVIRKNTQNEKQAIEQRFYKLFEQAPLGITLEDLDGRLLFVNPALCSMLGYNEQEMHGMLCQEFSVPGEVASDWALFQELQNGSRETYNIEKPLLRKDGTRMRARVSVSRLKFQTPGEPVVMAMVEDVTQEQETEDRLKEAQSALHQLPARLINAQEEERQRVARELHDDIGQRLSLAIIRLQELNRQISDSPDSPHLNLGPVLEELDELTSDVHQLSHQLHSSKLQHLGLRSALNELCRQITQQHRLRVVQEIEDAPDLSAEAQLCLYRVAQEALNNVVRHSRASEVSVRFSVDCSIARLEIADNGRGFELSSATAAGLGLASMRERLHAMNGELIVSATENSGTKIVAKVPVEDRSFNQRAS
jgi:PAS domain S-box-containing protein